MKARLIVNADDFGTSVGTTDGIIDAHKNGVVTSTSLLVTTPAFSHAVALARENPKLGIGLHFSLTAGRPCSPIDRIPSLVDANGFLCQSFSGLFGKLMFRSSEDLITQIKCELNAQLGRIRDAGLRIDHINSERHVHLIPPIFHIMVEAAREWKIPYVRLVRDAGWPYVGLSNMGHCVGTGGFLKSLLLGALSTHCFKELPPDVRVTDHYATLLFTGRMDLVLSDIFKNPPAGVTEVAVHPAFVAKAEAHTGNGSLERYLSSPNRERELQACRRPFSTQSAELVRFSDVTR
jgi:predicted glycoside hydrolase/deacetylase ChbG (UPF0249 family)